MDEPWQEKTTWAVKGTAEEWGQDGGGEWDG